jgi:hypothetical protein
VNATVSINVKPNPSAGTTPKLVLTRTLQRESGTNRVIVQVSLANTGGAAAVNTRITSAKIGTTPSSPPTVSVGTIAAGAVGGATLFFPASAGASGTSTTLTISGTYTGGTFSSSSRVTLP